MLTWLKGMRGGVGRYWPVVGLLLLGVLMRAISPALAQPSGYQEYFVLGYEEHIWRAFLAIYEGPDDHIPGRICSTVSLVATADHQVIYYDHWEDGYEADLLNPVQATTQVFGDGDPSNGGQGDDILLAGDALNLVSDQDVSDPAALNGYVPVDPVRDPAFLRYDGGDRVISSGGPVDLTHAMWPLDNSWVGGAWEVYSRQAFADTFAYRLPVGEDLYALGGGDTGLYGDLRNVYLELQAFEDDTLVVIDNGSEVVNLTLGRGELYSSLGYLNSASAPPITINAGTTIHSNKPTQVGLITGADSQSGDGFQGRFIVLLPDILWGSDYVVPVPSGAEGAEAEIYLANPNDHPITVHAYDAETQATMVLSPATWTSATLPYSPWRGGLGYVPQDSAARFTSSEGVFGLVVAADSSHVVYDWGFGGIPTKYLTRDYYVPWAPGTTDLSDNGSPIWVTPMADETTFFVDYSPLDGVVDESFTLDVLQQRRLFDPDMDNTGTHVWATGEFAMVWGEDPRTAGGSIPYLDLGVATLPLLQRWLEPVLTLDKTVQPTVLTAAGEVTFTLVAQSYGVPLSAVSLSDTLPLNWHYVPGTARITYPGGDTLAWEPVVNGQRLYWGLSASLDIHQPLTLTFRAAITSTGGVTRTAFDGFESGTYDGGANWLDDWQELGDDGDPAGGDVRIVEDAAPPVGTHHLQIRADNNGLARTVNLDGFIAPTLKFVRRLSQIELGDRFYLEVNAGSGWTTLRTWTVTDMPDQDIREVIDLTPYRSPATAIRFRSDGSVESDDSLYLDQIVIYEGLSISTNLGAAVGRDDYSGTLFNPTDQASVYISPLSLHKAVDRSQADIGETLVYTLTYANHSRAVTATNVVLRDALPLQHATFLSASPGAQFDPVGGTLGWELGDLPPGAGGSLTLTLQVNRFVDDGTLVENVAFLDSDQTRAGSNPVRTLVRAPDLVVNKEGPAGASPGQIITYTLTFRNKGGLEATGVRLSDTLPASVTYVPGSMAMDMGGGWVALTDAADGDPGAFLSPTLVVTPGLLPGGVTGRLRFQVRVRDDLPPDSLILNTAILDRDFDIPRPSNTLVTRLSSLLLSQQAETRVGGDPPAVAPGGLITFYVRYENVSDVISQTNVYLQERVPDLTRLETAIGGDQVAYSWDNGRTWTTTLPLTRVTHVRWYDAALPPNVQGEVALVVRLNDTLPPNTTVRNVAYITSTEMAPLWTDWLPSNEVTVGTVDLWLDKRADRAVAGPGEPVAYTLYYGNHGSADAYDVQLTDLVPDGSAYLPGSIWGQGADDGGEPLLSWQVLTVTAGAPARAVGYRVVTDPNLVPGTLVTNTAMLGSPFGTLLSNQHTLAITVPLPPALTLTKSAHADVVAPGARLTYTLRLTNTGGVARQLTVSDALPGETAFVGCGGATCALTDGAVVWGPLDLMGPGGELALTLVVQVQEGLPHGRPIVNRTYRATAENAPPTTGPPVTTTVSVPELSIAKWGFPNRVFIGSRLDYALRVDNSGGRATHLVVSDTLPAGTRFGGCDCSLPGLLSAASPANGACGQTFTCGLEEDTVVWRVDGLDAGGALQMGLWVTVATDLADGTVLVNDVYAVDADSVLPVYGTTPVTTPVSRLQLTITKVAWPNPVAVHQVLVYTLTVYNTGSVLQNLTVTDRLPAEVSFIRCGGALCELNTAGSQPHVRWWLPSLGRGEERQLTTRVLLTTAQSEHVVNAYYSVWVPAADEWVFGTPVTVSVVQGTDGPRLLFLPLLIRDEVP